MFEFLKRFFGYRRTARTAPVASAPAEAKGTGPDKRIASLSLLEILAKLPPELRTTIDLLPAPDVKIAMRVSKIMKQLPSGVVKIPFSKLRRQAPRGTFHHTKVDRKCMVELPLAEILKEVDPSRLERRPAQVEYEVPVSAVGVFGADGRTHCVIDPAVDPMKALWMPGVSPDRGEHEVKQPDEPVAPRMARPREDAVPGETRLVLDGDLSLPLGELGAGWPENIRKAVSDLPKDTTVYLPTALAGRSLNKGRVAFPWSQVREWLQPPVSRVLSIPDDLELDFPLKIVAPAFLAATTSGGIREGVRDIPNLPDFFGPKASECETGAPDPEEIPTSAPELTLSFDGETPLAHGDCTAASPAEPAATSPAHDVPFKLMVPGHADVVPLAAHRESGAISSSLPDFFSSKTQTTENSEGIEVKPPVVLRIASLPTPAAELNPPASPEAPVVKQAPMRATAVEPHRVPPAREDAVLLRRRTVRAVGGTNGKSGELAAAAREPVRVPPARDEMILLRRRTGQASQAAGGKVGNMPAPAAQPARVLPARDETILLRRQAAQTGPRAAGKADVAPAGTPESAKAPAVRDETVLLRRRPVRIASKAP